MAYATATQHAHDLIDRLEQASPAKVKSAVSMLEKMLDPVSWALKNAPFDEEEIGDDEREAASASRARGYSSSPGSHAELLRDLGLTANDWERMGELPVQSETAGPEHG